MHPGYLFAAAVAVTAATAWFAASAGEVDDDGRDVAAVLRLPPGAAATATGVLALDAFDDFVQLFVAAGKRGSGGEGDVGGATVPLPGRYRGDIPEGWPLERFLAAYVPGLSLGAYAGAYFDAASDDGDARGGNLFRPRASGGGEGISKPGVTAPVVALSSLAAGRTFRAVRYDGGSVFDGAAFVMLDYAESDTWPLRWLLRDEMRCVHRCLCVGFGGVLPLGGPRFGTPFVLWRDGSECPP